MCEIHNVSFGIYHRLFYKGGCRGVWTPSAKKLLTQNISTWIYFYSSFRNNIQCHSKSWKSRYMDMLFIFASEEMPNGCHPFQNPGFIPDYFHEIWHEYLTRVKSRLLVRTCAISLYLVRNPSLHVYNAHVMFVKLMSESKMKFDIFIGND